MKSKTLVFATFAIFFIAIGGVCASNVNSDINNKDINNLSTSDESNSNISNSLYSQSISEESNKELANSNYNSELININENTNIENTSTLSSNIDNINNNENSSVLNYNSNDSVNSNDSKNYKSKANETIISSYDMNIDHGDNQSYKVNISDNERNPIVGAKVNITLTNSYGDSKTYYKLTDSEGIANLGINLIPGTYTITYNYQNQSGTNTVKIASVAVLEGSDLSQTEGDNKYYEITLTDSQGNAIANKQISFTLINSLGGSKTYYLTTDSTGKARIQIGLSAGNYTVVYGYESINKTGKITIKTPTILTADDLSQTEGDGKYFDVTLTDKNGNALVGETVVITISNANGDSKTYNIKTDANGVARLQINLVAGSYGISYTYESDNYGVSTGSNTVNVKEENTLPTITITAKPSAGGTGLSYKWYTTTWINYCPLCGHYNTLTINPKGVYERELTCSYCDADYCGASGKEKSYTCKGYLTKA